MSVYIKGMTMPKKIEPELVVEFAEDIDGKRYARLHHYQYGPLTDWCSLAEVPDNHGDLIDKQVADKLNEKDYEAMGHDSYTDYARKVVLNALNAAPIIISTEGRDNNVRIIVYGKWETAKPHGCVSYAPCYAECSECHNVAMDGWKMNFCPNCGADMREES